MHNERKGLSRYIVFVASLALSAGAFGCGESDDVSDAGDAVTEDAGAPSNTDSGEVPDDEGRSEEPDDDEAGDEVAEEEVYEPVVCDEPIESADPDSKSPAGFRPIIFVHGGAGCIDQFESQAQRFVSNGYPADHITGYEYDSTMGLNSFDDIMQGIDQLIDKMLEETGATQVDLLGHSFGTTQSHNYLGSDAIERGVEAAKVAHYVNIDGRASEQPPGCVETLAIWAGLSAYRSERDPVTDEPTGEIIRYSDEERGQIEGAKNVIFRGVTHVEAASYAESFVEMYKLFNDGEEPSTTEILPEETEDIELSGRVIYFATNDSPQGFTLEMYEVDGDTGMRLDETPEATADIDGDGAFGPFDAKADVYYEFVIFDEDNVPETRQHFYYEPFIRSDYWIRLKTSPRDGISSMLTRDEAQTNMVISRNMEFVGDADIELYQEEEDFDNDSLSVDGIELCTPELSPASNRTVGMFATDMGADGENNLDNWIDEFAELPFISGADVFLPASDPPDDPIAVVVKNRKAPGTQQVLNVPNWISTEHRVSLQFRDFVQ